MHLSSCEEPQTAENLPRPSAQVSPCTLSLDRLPNQESAEQANEQRIEACLQTLKNNLMGRDKVQTELHRDLTNDTADFTQSKIEASQVPHEFACR